MKFATIKLILSLITISLVCSTNLLRSRTGDMGKGTWDAGYVCSSILIGEGSGARKNQGEATIFAKTVVEPNSDATRLGINFTFKSAPAADSYIVKIGTKVSATQYYIPFRFIYGNFEYNNPTRDPKTIIGSFTADNRLNYSLEIKLPYATFGWFITDDEAKKIYDQYNQRGVKARGEVTTAKDVISTNSEVYLQKKALLDAISKDKAALEAEIAKQKKDSAAVDAQLAALKTKIEEAKQAVFQKQNEVQNSVNALRAANAAVTQTSVQMTNIQNAVTGLKTPNAEQLTKTKASLATYTSTTDAAYADLKKEVASKVADFDSSKAGLHAADEAKFNSGLKSSYPN